MMSLSQSTIHQAKAPTAEFQLAQLEEDMIAVFIAGKPLIHESPSQLRTVFKFKSSLKEGDMIPSRYALTLFRNC